MDASFLISSFKPLPKGSYRENIFNGVEEGGNFIQNFIKKNYMKKQKTVIVKCIRKPASI